MPNPWKTKGAPKIVAYTKGVKKNFKKKYHRKKGLVPVTTTFVRKSLQSEWTDRYRIKVRNTTVLNSAGVAGAAAANGVPGNFLHGIPPSPIIGANKLLIGNFTSTNTVNGLGSFLQDATMSPNAPYLQFRIHACSISIELLPLSGTSNDFVSVVVIPVTTSDASNMVNVNAQTIQGMYEQNHAKHVTVSGFGINKVPKIKHYMTTRKMFGLKYAASLEDGQYDCQSGLNPASSVDQWFWYIYTGPATSNTTAMEMVATMEYDIEFFNLSPNIAFTA